MASQQPDLPATAVPAPPQAPVGEEKISTQPPKNTPEVAADAQSADEKRGTDESDVEYDTKEKQFGVEKIRAITASWSWTALISIYAL